LGSCFGVHSGAPMVASPRVGSSLPKRCPQCGTIAHDDSLYCERDGALLLAEFLSGEGNAATEPDPYLGMNLLGQVEIRSLLGIGAMGRVYRAFQQGVDRDVAVKILHANLSSNTSIVDRFLREAKVASKLVHPNVVQVFLSGKTPDGSFCMVMELLEGLSLQSALMGAEARSLSLSRTLHVVLQLCDALGEAHKAGVVHRDLKPENIMLVRRGEDPDFVKVLDFGIARATWGAPAVATATGLIFGTARYLSPEGAQGEHVGPPADVYSLATLTYQLLAGRTPFDGDRAVDVLIRQIN
jgi:eukaryotic-like serine/threonine-protein kinase